MTDIELVNEGGKIVAKDIDTGETVPIELGETEADALSAEEAHITENFEIDRSQNNPHPARSFEASGPITARPYPSASNPVLEGSDVSDRAVDSVADPFMVHESGNYHMFMETFNDGNKDGDIGHAESDDGVSWTYNTTVLDESVHLSWPYVFKWDGTWYMIPSNDDGDLRIYSADSFPDTWTLEETVLTGSDIRDPIPIPWNDTWYIIAYDSTNTDKRVYYSDTWPSFAGGSWSSHPSNPIHSGTGDNPTRNGGRAIPRRDSIDVFFQQHNQEQTRSFRITELSTDTYDDVELSTSPITQRSYNNGWNAEKMHHVDAMMPYIGGKDLILVDGAGSDGWSVGMFTSSEVETTAFDAYPANFDSAFGPGAWNPIPLDDIGHDIGGDVDTANDVFVVPSSGYYMVSATIQFGDIPSSDCTVRTRIYNDTSGSGVTFGANAVPSGASTASVQSPPKVAYLDSGDELRLDGYQDSGSDISRQDGPQGTFLTGYRVW